MSSSASGSDQMRAMIVDRAGDTPRLAWLPRPVPGPGEVTVDVVACGAGLTLELARDGSLGGTFPRVLGHELSGRIREIGPNVTTWRPGDRVTTSFYLTCGRCYYCARGRETLCLAFEGFVGAAIDGGFADTVRLPARNLIAVPVEVPLADAGVIADAIATPLHVVNSRLALRPGDWVAVLGAGGGLGVHALGVLKATGALTLAVDSSEPKRERLALGAFADQVRSPDDWVAAARELNGGGVASVIDCVGTQQTLNAGLAGLAPGGTLVVLGASSNAIVNITGLDAILREITVTGTRYTNRLEIAQALELVSAGRIVPIIGARYALEHLAEAFEAIRRGDVFGRIVIDVTDIEEAP